MEKSHGTVHSQAQIFLKKQQQGGSVEGESEEAAAPKRCVSNFFYSHTFLQNFRFEIIFRPKRRAGSFQQKVLFFEKIQKEDGGESAPAAAAAAMSSSSVQNQDKTTVTASDC